MRCELVLGLSTVPGWLLRGEFLRVPGCQLLAASSFGCCQKGAVQPAGGAGGSAQML